MNTNLNTWLVTGDAGLFGMHTGLPMQPGGVPATSANTDELGASFGLKPNTSVRDGVENFARWYRGYFRL
jgi:hypothetical protein